MKTELIECVVNVSEGRDPVVLQDLSRAASACSGCYLLDLHSDADHHRSVFTLLGDRRTIVDGAVSLAGRAVELIDLFNHQGVHPRIGAVDVVPFVPLEGTTTSETVELARRFGSIVVEELQVPVYFYGDAALSEDRRELSDIRRGGFERLRERVVADEEWRPDLGSPRLHPTAGAVAVGVRPILIALNVELEPPADLAAAQSIAARIRSRNGGLPAVKALGLALPGRGLVQVSMNLTDYHVTPPFRAVEAIRREAARLGCRVGESELVGLIPEAALSPGALQIGLRDFSSSQILENRIEEVTGRRPQWSR